VNRESLSSKACRVRPVVTMEECGVFFLAGEFRERLISERVNKWRDEQY
jgi:hypothetical protein